MILTSNCGFAEWGDIFGSPVVATALLDRLLHHAIVIQIEGSSYRMREHAALLPENMHANTAVNSATPKRRGRLPIKQPTGQPMPDYQRTPSTALRKFSAHFQGKLGAL